MAAGQIRLAQVLQLKVKGTDTALPVPFGGLAEMRAAFQAAHRARFGFDPGEARAGHRGGARPRRWGGRRT